MDIMLIMDSGGDGYYSWDFTGLEEARPISEYRQVPDVVDAQSCLQLTELVHWWLQVIPLLVFVGDGYKFVPDALSCVCRMGPTEVFFFFFLVWAEASTDPLNPWRRPPMQQMAQGSNEGCQRFAPYT